MEVIAEYPLFLLKTFKQMERLLKNPSRDSKAKIMLDGSFSPAREIYFVRLSHPNTAVLIDKDQEGLLIPSYFANVEIIDHRSTARLCCMVFNTDKVKGELLKTRSGTHIPSTNKQILEKISIPSWILSNRKRLLIYYNSIEKKRVCIKN